MPEYLDHLSPFIDTEEGGPTAFFTRFRRFGPSFESSARRIAELEPDIVFISSIAYCYLDDLVQLGRELRAAAPGVPLVVGGPGVSVAVPRPAELGLFDVLVAGEAERAMDAVLSAAGSLRAGGAARTAATAVVNAEPADEIALVYGLRRTSKRIYLTTQLTRGCPFDCAFCSTHLTLGRKTRRVSLGTLERGLPSLTDGVPIHINIEDDNLFLDRAYARAAIRTMSERWPGCTLSAENGLDYRNLTENDIRFLVESGFVALNFTLGSASDALIREQRREADSKHLQRLIEAASRAGVRSVTYFICGLATDTPAGVLETLERLASWPTLIGISPFYPVPGLPGFEDLAVDRAIAPGLCAGSSAFPWTGSLTTAQIVTAFRLSRLLNLAKKRRKTEGEKRLLTQAFGRRKLITRKPNDDFRIYPARGADPDMEAGFFDRIRVQDIEPLG